MKNINTATPLLLSVLIMCLAAHSAVAAPIYPDGAPEWASDPAATRASYNFPNNNTTPPPTDYVNPSGEPQSEITLGDFATGWQDPQEGEYDTTRGNEGAWDMGDEGTFSIVLPVDYPSADSVKIAVYTIGYDLGEGMVQLPDISIEGLTATNVSEIDEFFENDDGPGSWRSLTWSGTVSPGDLNSLTVKFTAQQDGSLIDGADIYMIPEPSTWLVLVFAGLTFLAFNRFSSQTAK